MKNILEFLEKTAPLYGEKIAFADEEQSLSFADLLKMSRAGGSELIKKVLKKFIIFQ